MREEVQRERVSNGRGENRRRRRLGKERINRYTSGSASIGDVQNIIYAKYLKDLSFIQKVDDISFGK